MTKHYSKDETKKYNLIAYHAHGLPYYWFRRPDDHADITKKGDPNDDDMLWTLDQIKEHALSGCERVEVGKHDMH